MHAVMLTVQLSTRLTSHKQRKGLQGGQPHQQGLCLRKAAGFGGQLTPAVTASATTTTTSSDSSSSSLWSGSHSHSSSSSSIISGRSLVSYWRLDWGLLLLAVTVNSTAPAACAEQELSSTSRLHTAVAATIRRLCITLALLHSPVSRHRQDAAGPARCNSAVIDNSSGGSNTKAVLRSSRTQAGSRHCLSDLRTH